MDKLIDGVRRFQQDVLPGMRALFERLGEGQQPEVVFITCADSRIDPWLITQSKPGDLFVLRNAGNILPPYPSPVGGGVSASLEFALEHLPIRHIVVCGHSDCGAIRALLHPQEQRHLASLSTWLAYAEPARQAMLRAKPGLEGDALLTAVIQQNVVQQLDHLRQFPAVTARLAAGSLELHGWFYDIPTGQVHCHCPQTGRFAPLAVADQGL